MSFNARDQFGLFVACDPGDTVGLTARGVVIEATSKFMRVQLDSGNETKVYSADDRKVSMIRKFVRPEYKNRDVVMDPLTGNVWQFSADRYCKDRCCTYWMRTGSSVAVGDEEFREAARQDQLVLISRNGKPYVPPVDVLGRFTAGGSRGSNGSSGNGNTMSTDLFANASF